mmetsp:Transcript_31213/g.120135  ORF Transcript_31213/g.120135 Transcript_31213/m.120135 type:complete len:83 (+) Transcript_31213:102-350(+)
MSFVVKTVETKPIEGQKTGTSGLRKKTKLFMSENYLANWVQSLFNSLDDLEGLEMLVAWFWFLACCLGYGTDIGSWNAALIL